ncbi:hypothetical protein D3C79_235520 [compost metagenome]
MLVKTEPNGCEDLTFGWIGQYPFCGLSDRALDAANRLVIRQADFAFDGSTPEIEAFQRKGKQWQGIDSMCLRFLYIAPQSLDQIRGDLDPSTFGGLDNYSLHLLPCKRFQSPRKK